MTSVGLLDAARVELGLSVFDLWLSYFTLGGTKTAAELATYLSSGDHGDGPATSVADHDAVVHALNEAYGDRGDDHPLRYRAP